MSRTIPDYSALEAPTFDAADASVLADGIAQLKFSYFGRDPDANDAVDPTWRDRWDDPQILPLLIRMDVTTAQGRELAAADGRAQDRAGGRLPGVGYRPQAVHGVMNR